MAYTNRTNNQPQDDDNLIDFDIEVRAKLHPKGKELIETTIEAGKTIIKFGRIAIPLLAALTMGLKSCAPKPPQVNPPALPSIESSEQPPQ